MLLYLLVLLLSFVFTEFCGYFIHIVLHSQKFEFLSRNHMIHHLKVYGPKSPQRPDEKYRNSVENRAAVLGIGMEWIFPTVIVLSSIFLVSYFFEVPMVITSIFTAGSIFWGYFLFGYMHDNLHIKNFWMQDSKLLGKWFCEVRRLHDIHHLDIDDEGKMKVNYGICFFFFDRLFGSYKNKFSQFNNPGYDAAIKKYDFINS